MAQFPKHCSGARSQKPSIQPTWLKLAMVGVSAAVLGGAYVFLVEPDWLAVTRHQVVIGDLPTALDGLVVAHLSDLHVTRETGQCSAVAQAIRVCQDEKPDLVLLTGDFAGERKGVAKLEEMISRLRPLPSYGVFGNHEYQHGPSHRRNVARALESSGVTLLNNRTTVFEKAGERLWLVGVDDAYTGRDRLDIALSDLSLADRPRILLSHYPDLLHQIHAPEVDLALAGHTHGAQINLPLLARSALAHADSRYLGGMFRVNGVPLYVSRGLGTSGHRVRLFARPELAFLTLRSPVSCQCPAN